MEILVVHVGEVGNGVETRMAETLRQGVLTIAGDNADASNREAGSTVLLAASTKSTHDNRVLYLIVGALRESRLYRVAMLVRFQKLRQVPLLARQRE